jgi:hypothetical protein
MCMSMSMAISDRKKINHKRDGEVFFMATLLIIMKSRLGKGV